MIVLPCDNHEFTCLWLQKCFRMCGRVSGYLWKTFCVLLGHGALSWGSFTAVLFNFKVMCKVSIDDVGGRIRSVTTTNCIFSQCFLFSQGTTGMSMVL